MDAAGLSFKIEVSGVVSYTHLPLSATILDLKRRIAFFYRIPVERLILQCIEPKNLHYRLTLQCIEAKDLQDDRTIESYHSDRDNHINILAISAKPPTPAPVEKSNLQMKEGEKNTDDAKKEKE